MKETGTVTATTVVPLRIQSSCCKMKMYETGNGGAVMSFDVLARDMFETLSTEQKAEVVDFIFFLSTRQKRAEDSKPVHEGSFPFDCLAGGLSYIADDFDAPMDDFREYMQ